jgi:hypothetical protein
MYERNGFWCFSLGTRTKEDESSAGRNWAAGFHHVMALYMFFWVFPWRQIVFCQRFGILFILQIEPLKMDLTEGSEMSAKHRRPGNTQKNIYKTQNTAKIWNQECYGLFSLGMRFETYEPFFPSILQFFSGCSKQWMLNQQIWGHNCTLN